MEAAQRAREGPAKLPSRSYSARRGDRRRHDHSPAPSPSHPQAPQAPQAIAKDSAKDGAKDGAKDSATAIPEPSAAPSPGRRRPAFARP
jgi:hypothetical protein